MPAIDQPAPAAAPQPLLVSWNITGLCNLACSHCYLDATRRRRGSRDELNTAAAARIVGEIAALAPGAMLVFSGGEPLLRRDLDTLVQLAAGSGLAPVIGTNGTLLTGSRAKRTKDAGAAGVGISLDSAGPAFHDRLRGVPGAWHAALRGAADARRAGLPVLLQATLFEDNRNDIAALADLAESLGAVALNFFFLVCTGRGATRTDLAPAAYEETLARIIELQRARPRLIVRARCAPYQRRLLGLHAGEGDRHYAGWSGACLAGRSYFRITPLGKVTPCPYIPTILGDLATTPLREIWERHPFLMRLRTELPAGKCGGCDFRYSCGGCRARALARHGDVLAEDPNCLYAKPPELRPEPQPVCQARREVAWEPEARALLERIPAFVRAVLKARIDERAAREGRRIVTVDYMHAHRPPLDRLRPGAGSLSPRPAAGDPQWQTSRS
ncbi:MAG: radical SAM protein [Betaproteobacteria bacterium]|nr:radical SAM protein [Betaproteobacteria bacterium]